MVDKSSSSRRWLREHFSDEYVKRAQLEGWRSRAVYKLQEMHQRDKLFKTGMTVIDLGAAPGSWSEFVVKQIGRKGRVIALDILPMLPIAGVDFIQGDFNDEAVLETLLRVIDDKPVHWVLSDMAPNMSGMESVDLPRAMGLAELSLELAVRLLNASEGGFLVKAFQGVGFDDFLMQVRSHFKRVVIRKPKASRSRSNEVYILAQVVLKKELPV